MAIEEGEEKEKEGGLGDGSCGDKGRSVVIEEGEKKENEKGLGNDGGGGGVAVDWEMVEEGKRK